MGGASHFDQEQFVSCEDQLPPLHGIYNYACSVSGLVILLLQLLPVYTIVGRHRELLNMDSALYLAALLFLFYLNLHQHLTGYVRVDLDSGGCIHSVFLALWLNNSLGSKCHIPITLARTLAIGGALILLAVCAWEPSQQSSVGNVLNGAALYTVITMGQRSYRIAKNKSNDRSFYYWCGAVVSLLSVQTIVVVEKEYVCETVAARLFHAIVIHALIVSLFSCVFACAIRIIAHEHHSTGIMNGSKKE